MNTGVLRCNLECSSSGRGYVCNEHSTKRTTPRVTNSQAPAPVTRWLPAPQRLSSSCLPQPPLRQKEARRQRSPQQVAQELSETSSSKEGGFLDVDELNAKWGIPDAIEFGYGQGDLPTVLLTHPQTGMQMVIYLYGATIAQWLKPNGTATFYDGPDELYQPGMPLRTGVSLHFPQHREGLVPEHGFADRMLWEVVGAGFDCPEILDQLQGWQQTLAAHGVVTEEMLEQAAEGGEAAKKVAEILSRESIPDSLVATDLSPCITLRLRDTPQTRALWPHRFELEYKITLQIQDMTLDEWREQRAADGLDPNANPWDEGEEEEGEGGEAGEGEEGEGEEPRVRFEAANADEEEEEDVDEEEEGAEVDAAAAGVTAAEAESAPSPAAVRKRGRPPKEPQPTPAVAAGAASSGSDNEDDDDDDDEEDEEGWPGRGSGEAASVVSPTAAAPAVQIKQEFWVRNKDAPGSAPMHFNLGSLARFVTMAIPECRDWVKVLGLGGSQTFDYTADPRYPALDLCQEDFLHFRGQPVDVTYVGAADATVMLCPGNRTHYEFIQRQGFRDMFIEQPSVYDNSDYDSVVAIGTGFVATTKKLSPGETWFAESIIRFHDRYWNTPIFGDDTMPPLAPLSQDLLAGEEGEGEGSDVYDDIPSEPTGPSADGDM